MLKTCTEENFKHCRFGDEKNQGKRRKGLNGFKDCQCQSRWKFWIPSWRSKRHRNSNSHAQRRSMEGAEGTCCSSGALAVSNNFGCPFVWWLVAQVNSKWAVRVRQWGVWNYCIIGCFLSPFLYDILGFVCVPTALGWMFTSALTLPLSPTTPFL